MARLEDEVSKLSAKQKWLLALLLFVSLLITSGCLQWKSYTKTGEEQPSSAAEEAGIPIYAGSEAYRAPTFLYQIIRIPTEGISVKVYYVRDATASEILSWYKEKMKDKKLINEIRISRASTPQGSVEWGGLLFQEDSKAIGIYAMSGSMIEKGRGTIYYIMEGPIEKFVGEREKLPSEDVVSGEEPVSRYPNSVMISYDKYDSYIVITYGTGDGVDAVFDWYKNHLSLNNWEIKSESKEEDSYSLEAKRGNETVGIIIYPPSDEKDYTEIDIHYGVEEEEEKQSIQPTSSFGVNLDTVLRSILQTVSGGEVVLTSYSEFEMEGTVNVMMEYSLSSPVEDLSAFVQGIKTELTERGFSNIYASTSGDSAGITFSGEIDEGYIGMVSINIYKNSDIVSIYVSSGE